VFYNPFGGGGVFPATPPYPRPPLIMELLFLEGSIGRTPSSGGLGAFSPRRALASLFCRGDSQGGALPPNTRVPWALYSTHRASVVTLYLM